MSENNIQAENRHPSPITPTTPPAGRQEKEIKPHHIFLYLTFILCLISILVTLLLTIKDQQKPPIKEQNTAQNISSYPTLHHKSDNSYISFAVNNGINITVKNQYGKSVGQTYLNQPIDDPTKQNHPSPPKPKLLIFEYAKPESGQYTIELNSESDTPRSFQLDGTFITQEGDTKTETIKGTLDPKVKKIFLLSYDKQIAKKTQINIIPTINPTTSGSDLSYLMIVSDPNLDMKLLDTNGNQISEASTQQPIADPANPENKNEHIKQLYFQKPNTGNYKLITSSNINKIYKISIYFYDINGNIFMTEIKTTGTASFDIYFNKKNSKESYIKNK